MRVKRLPQCFLVFQMCRDSWAELWEWISIQYDTVMIQYDRICSPPTVLFSIPEIRICGWSRILSSRSGPLACVNQCATRNCFECFGARTRPKTCGVTLSGISALSMNEVTSRVNNEPTKMRAATGIQNNTAFGNNVSVHTRSLHTMKVAMTIPFLASS